MSNIIKIENIDIINYIKKKKYISLNCYQKYNIIIQCFYFKIWDKINSEYRILILQEFENIQAKIQKREPYKIIILENDSLLMDFAVCIKTKKLFVRKSYLLNAKKQNLTNDKINLYVDSKINMELLDGILHEQNHILLHKLKDQHRYYKEVKEYIMWLYWLKEKNITNYNLDIKNYLEYRMRPDEFYAFAYAEKNIRLIYEKLQFYYGEEENIHLYFNKLNESKLKVENEYYNKYGIKLKYAKIYEEYLKTYIKATKRDEINLLNNIQKTKSFF